jgi:hypothetical protein
LAGALITQDEHDNKGKYLCAVSSKQITSQPVVMLTKYVTPWVLVCPPVRANGGEEKDGHGSAEDVIWPLRVRRG